MKTVTCPVCGGPAMQQEYWCDAFGSTLEEKEVDCQAQCYRYQYSCGTYCVRVGNRKWQWSYNTPPDEKTAILAEIKAAKAAAVELRQ